MTPREVFLQWLTSRPKDARVVVTVDGDRLLNDAGVLGPLAITDNSGRQWQLAVFRGDDLAFRLRFCKVSSQPTVIVITRGGGTLRKIEVSTIADILGKNEGSEPLGLSLPALFRRLCLKINFPASELLRYQSALFECIEAVPRAAAKIVERWGKPDDWGRGQVAAMLVLARRPELALAEIWPDETDPVQFVAHSIRMLLGFPALAADLEIVCEMVREAARPQVRDQLHWLDVAPSELAAYLVFRRFAGDAGLQNPSNQLAGLMIFPPELDPATLEPLAPLVISFLQADARTWTTIEALSEAFLTPRRVQKALALLAPADRGPEGMASAVLRQAMAPALLRECLRSILIAFFAHPDLTSLAWVTEVADHPLLKDTADLLPPRAAECRAALNLLLTLRQIEARLAIPQPAFQRPEDMLDWYLQAGHHRMELEVAQAFHLLEACGDGEITTAGVQYLFGGDDLAPSASSLKGRIRARLDALDQALADFVNKEPAAFRRGARSAFCLIRERVRETVSAVILGASQGRVWILVFDGMRFDTWDVVIRPIFAEHFSIDTQLSQSYYAVLPTYTQVARTSLFAGCEPYEWRGYKGSPTRDEATLIARNLGLSQADAEAKLRLVAEADTAKSRMEMGFAEDDAKNVNVLIYPISDECHEFRADLAAFNNKIRTEMLGDKGQGIRGILDDVLRRVRPEDLVLVTSDHGFIELLRPDGRLITQADASRAGRSLQDDVRLRHLKGFRPPPEVPIVEMPGPGETHYLAVGRNWFRREGSKTAPRYDHGGLSLAEMAIPGAVLKRITEKAARVEIVGLPQEPIAVGEDAKAELRFAVENTGNVACEFDLRVQNNLGEELLSHRGKLSAGQKSPAAVTLTGIYRENAARETDLSATLTAVTARLCHTDPQGRWREAIDGIITVPVKIRAKRTRLDTDALRGLDDV